MGMLFNTPGTLRLIVKLNIAFDRANFATLKTHPPTGFDPGGVNGTGAHGIYEKVCVPLGITDATTSVNNNWIAFLNILDTTPTAGTTSISAQIGTAIAQALAGIAPHGNDSAVEFFAVPDNVTVPSVKIIDFPDHNGDTTLIVEVTTATLTALLEARHRERR